MKRLLSVLCVLVVMLGLLVLPAQAAGSGSLSMGSGSGNRGDTVTLSVNLSSNPGLVTMTIRVSYDTSVLQLIGVSNPGLLVGAQLNTSYGSPYTISWVDGATTTNNTRTGTIATLTFKILDSAKVGDSTVSLQFIDSYDTDYNANSFSASSGKVTVKCSHSYSGWTDAGNGQHSRTCTICSGKENANHTWNSGTVTKQPTCKAEGTKTFTCTTCNTTKTESIAKTTDHKYGSWRKVDNAAHMRTCSGCSVMETENHAWNSGTVTKEPNCTEEGTKVYTCTACSATKTETLAKTQDHDYGPWISENATVHKHSCTRCSRKDTAFHTWNSGTVTKQPTCKAEGTKTFTCTTCNATMDTIIDTQIGHTYDNGCDKSCNICGSTRTVAHNYKTSLSSDKSSHWYECSVCKDKKNVNAHTPGPEATETKAQICTTCGYTIKAALGHKHSYATTWSADASSHWYACTGCAEQGSGSAHDFENACDMDCSVCGFTRETVHQFADAWSVDADNHWHTCTVCGALAENAAHEPGPEPTATTAQVCTICAYEIAPALGIEETKEPTEMTEVEEYTETTEPVAPATSEEQTVTEKEDYTMRILLTAAAVAICGVATILVIKKKKR